MNNFKTASVSVKCPFSLKSEKVYVSYANYNDSLFVLPQGCDKNFHDCKECADCLIKAQQVFREDSSKK